MTLEVWVSNDAGEYHQIDVLDLQYTTYRDFQQGESLTFETAWATPIKPLNFVRLEENGSVLFRGAALANSGKISISTVNGTSIRQKLEGTAKWECESIPQLLKRRYSWPMRWGAPAITSGYEALTNAHILSDAAPSQSEGVDQYVPGAIWMAQSYMPISPTTRDNGIWYFSGWGASSRAGSRDVYVGGHLCTEVDALGELTEDYYRVYRNLNDLWVYGYGPGDFGPVCIDGAFDYGLRLGVFDRGGEYNLAAIDIGVENYWQFIEDYLKNNGLYIKLRHTEEATYIDATTSSHVRGSAAFGKFSIRPSDCTSLKRSAPKNIPPAALITLGKGVDISRNRFTLFNMNYRGAWIEELLEVPNGRVSPYGVMDVAAYDYWQNISESDYITLETEIGYLRPGDWINIDFSEGEIVTGQISEIQRNLSTIRKIKVGGAQASADYAYLEAQKSAAIEAMTAGQHFGTHAVSDLLGPSDVLHIAWTPIAADVRDTAEVVLSLEPTAIEECNERGITATYMVTITNTIYPEGRVIAIIPWRPWCSDEVNPFEDMDISAWCALDGTEESIDVAVFGPTAPIYHMVRVDGIGRYNQSRPIVTMVRSDIMSPVSNTMNSISDAHPYWSPETWGPFMRVVMPSIVLADAQPFLFINGNRYYGESRKVEIGWSPASVHGVNDVFEVNPYTLNPWTQSDINALQIGVKLSIGGTSGEAIWDLPSVGAPGYNYTVVVVSEHTMPLAVYTDGGVSLDVLTMKLWVELR